MEPEEEEEEEAEAEALFLHLCVFFSTHYFFNLIHLLLTSLFGDDLVYNDSFSTWRYVQMIQTEEESSLIILVSPSLLSTTKQFVVIAVAIKLVASVVLNAFSPGAN